MSSTTTPPHVPLVFMNVSGGKDLYLRRVWLARLNYFLETGFGNLRPLFIKNKTVITVLYDVLYIHQSSISEYIVAFNKKTQLRDVILKLPIIPSHSIEQDYGIGKAGWSYETANLLFSNDWIPGQVTVSRTPTHPHVPPAFMNVSGGKDIYLRRVWLARLHYFLERGLGNLRPLFLKNKAVIAVLYDVLYVHQSSIKEYIVAFDKRKQLRDAILKLPIIPSHSIKQDYGIGKAGWSYETVDLLFSDNRLPVEPNKQEFETYLFYLKTIILLQIAGVISLYGIF